MTEEEFNQQLQVHLDIIVKQGKEISRLKQALLDIQTLSKLPENKTIREITVNTIGEEGV